MLMPRLADPFVADTSGRAKGGRATIESHGPQLGNAGRKSSTDSRDEFTPVLSSHYCLPLLLRAKSMQQVTSR